MNDIEKQEPKQLSLTEDRETNTRMLMEVPGLVDTMAIYVGSAIFIPAAIEDSDKPWKSFNIDIDGVDRQFFCKHTEVPRTIFPYPATAFTSEGLKFIFKHSPPPPELFYCIKMQVEYNNNKQLSNT